MTEKEDNEIKDALDEFARELTEDATETDEPHPVSNVPVIPQLSVALGLLVFVFGITYLGATRSLSEKEPDPVYVTAEPSTPKQGMVSRAETFENITLEAESAFVWDVKNQKVLFNKNADATQPLASITKLMTALVTSELLGKDDTVPITLDALKADGDSGLTDGETFTVENLTDIVLIESSNDGATALAAQGGKTIEKEDGQYAFVAAMNVRAKELGLTKTTYKNSTGLDVSETEAGAVGSARDVAKLMDYLITRAPHVVMSTKEEVATIPNQDGEYHSATNTNELVGITPGLIASKTGYTSLSGGNLVVAVNAGLNRPIVVVVLGSSYEGRFRDTKKLVDRTLQSLGE